jgi:catechol 2,3-dioxygenase-like lactoylglutathione lyase family enzyme
MMAEDKSLLTAATMVGFLVTTDYERARIFYVDKLGFEFVSHDQFALAVRAGANAIRINRAEGFKPAQGTVLGGQGRAGDCAVVKEPRGGYGEVSVRGGQGTGDLDGAGRDGCGVVRRSGRECFVGEFTGIEAEAAPRAPGVSDERGRPGSSRERVHPGPADRWGTGWFGLRG